MCSVYGRTGATIATQTDRRAFCTRSVPTAIDVRARAGRGTRNNNGGRFYLPRNRPIHAGTIQLEEQTCVGRSVSQNLQRPRQGGQPSPALLLYVAVGVQAYGRMDWDSWEEPAGHHPASRAVHVCSGRTNGRTRSGLLAGPDWGCRLAVDGGQRSRARQSRSGRSGLLYGRA